jgi:hypothetical protein
MACGRKDCVKIQARSPSIAGGHSGHALGWEIVDDDVCGHATGPVPGRSTGPVAGPVSQDVPLAERGASRSAMRTFSGSTGHSVAAVTECRRPPLSARHVLLRRATGRRAAAVEQLGEEDAIVDHRLAQLFGGGLAPRVQQ